MTAFVIFNLHLPLTTHPPTRQQFLDSLQSSFMSIFYIQIVSYSAILTWKFSNALSPSIGALDPTLPPETSVTLPTLPVMSVHL